ncbi:nuclear poly(A) polymerase 4-like [Rhodamnia argentea]|uniref:Poly(A) polymerase n=1 Tax=Rhodamnia argentea TaxID=178133 RepID=A0A8B8NXM8_9MYRT|nr:nuclear poly(A) polymerase 4-like [Rhodamnia argentea]
MKQFGITEPMSELGPNEADIQRSRELEKIVKDWVKQVARLHRYSDEMVEDANAVIFTFGPYRLGVTGPGDDIDTLCVGPSYVNREEDFFIKLHDILAQMEEVTELQPVRDARVPVMKFKYDGISIDLLYASISLLVVPDELDISQVSVLGDIHSPTVRSLNGCRVAVQILKLVPNVEVTGFLGRVNWALLVARVCQLYPNAIPSMLVSQFFRVYTQWPWPNPVMLCPIEKDELGFSVWDPRRNPDDHMPIITPVYPCMNSSSNVSIKTLCVMMEQFKFGNNICQKIELDKAQWSALFEHRMFFKSYESYLQVDVLAADADDLRSWEGRVQSRLRQLPLMQIERNSNGKLECHLYPHKYVNTSKQCAHTAFFVGLQRKQGEKVLEGQWFNICGTVDEFRHAISMYKFWKLGMEIYVSHVHRWQIPSHVFANAYKLLRLTTPTQHEGEKAYSEDAHVCKCGSAEKDIERKKGSRPPSRMHCTVSPHIFTGNARACLVYKEDEERVDEDEEEDETVVVSIRTVGLGG